MPRTSMTALLAGAALLMLLSSLASAVPPDPERKPPDPPPVLPDDPVRFLATIEFASAYYYRGFVQETEGLIAQPAFRAELDLFRAEDDADAVLRRISAVAGVRNSLHSEQTGADGAGPAVWYEADLAAGFAFRFLDRWRAEALYVAITSPNGAFPTIREIDLALAYDDAGLWPGDFAIQPYARLAYELDGSAAVGDEGVLLQFGIEPGFGLIRSRDFPLRLSFPVLAGFSLDDYYVLPFGPPDDDAFGYVKTGVTLTAPLTFIPPGYGRWAVRVGADVIFLGGNMETFNRGEDSDIIARIGLGVKY